MEEISLTPEIASLHGVTVTADFIVSVCRARFYAPVTYSGHCDRQGLRSSPGRKAISNPSFSYLRRNIIFGRTVIIRLVVLLEQ